jgi:hypothetical protein
MNRDALPAASPLAEVYRILIAAARRATEEAIAAEDASAVAGEATATRAALMGAAGDSPASV